MHFLRLGNAEKPAGRLDRARPTNSIPGLRRYGVVNDIDSEAGV
jgi:hypothetical protein